MSLFAISDLHLSLSADKPMDIFKGWADYVERLQKNWTKIVNENDTVVIPGDISWAMKLEDTKRDFEFINALPGKKLLLKGNHDYWWTTMNKMKSFLNENEFNSIDFIHNNTAVVDDVCVCGTRGWFFDDEASDKKVLLREAGRLNESIQQAKKTGLEPIVFLHYPPVTRDCVCEEIFRILKENDIKRCFYGHIHGSASFRAVSGLYEGICLKPVSCDLLEFIPLKVN